MVIFDPYFDVAGLGLMLLCASPEADYIVFTSLPKPSKEGEVTPDESGKPNPDQVNNLVVNCEYNRHRLKHIKLRIYGLKDRRLHDRYILILGSDGLPVAGFNLSNSLQATAESHPLLITPIPSDTLLSVEQYKLRLVQEAQAARPEDETKNPAMRLLFDSTASTTAPRRYEPLRFLDKAQAGNVISAWTGEPSLQGLSGNPLRKRMAALGLLREGSLKLPETTGLRNCLGQQAGDFADFTSTWEVLGEVLAYSHIQNHHLRELESEHSFLEYLVRFLETSFNRAHDEGNKDFAVIDARLFREPIEALLHSSYHPHHLFHATKYATLSWPEYFTIKFLWQCTPDALLAIAEAQANDIPMEPHGSDVVRLSLLSQIVSEVSLSVQFDISEEQRHRLVRSSNGMLQWMGLNTIEMQLEKPEGLDTVLQLVAAFTYSERVRALGWMVQHAAGNPKKAEIYKGLISALHEALPATIPAHDLRHLVNSMRGHMRQLTWTEPWLFQDVVFPLLENDRANTDDACEIWAQELIALLGPELNRQPRLFERAREGQLTNSTALLFAYSSRERQQSCQKPIRAILQKQRRILQQPLASTSNWTRWDDALAVSMWILAFIRWSQYYLHVRGVSDYELEDLSQAARELALLRPMNEWQTEGTSKRGELAAFLDQAEGLLASSDESNRKRQ